MYGGVAPFTPRNLRPFKAPGWALIEALSSWANLFGHCVECDVIGDRREANCWLCEQPYMARSEHR